MLSLDLSLFQVEIIGFCLRQLKGGFENYIDRKTFRNQFNKTLYHMY